MGNAALKTKYDDYFDGMTVAVEGVSPRPYGPTTVYIPEDITLPRLKLGELGRWLAGLSRMSKQVLASCVVLCLVGSLCASVQLWSSNVKAATEKSRTETRVLEGQIAEFSAMPGAISDQVFVSGAAN